MTGDALNSEWDEWEHEVATFVLDALPKPPCRVLDVGCGSGWLVRALDELGYDARGVDPQARDGDPLITCTRLEEFDPDRSFDVVVAVLPLHHVDDVDLVVARIGQLLAPGGLMLCVEFAWDRFDDDTARWCIERLPAEPDEKNWLHALCVALRERQHEGGTLAAAQLIQDWAAERGFHSSEAMLERLRERFVEEHLEWGPYLYPELAVSADEERTAMEQGRVAATSFRFIGRTR